MEWTAPPVAAEGLNGFVDGVSDGGGESESGYKASRDTGGTGDISVVI